MSDTPVQAAAALEAAGYRVLWRRVHTTAEGVALSDAVTGPVVGTIVDILLGSPDAYLFVADPADPASRSPGPPHC